MSKGPTWEPVRVVDPARGDIGRGHAKGNPECPDWAWVHFLDGRAFSVPLGWLRPDPDGTPTPC